MSGVSSTLQRGLDQAFASLAFARESFLPQLVLREVGMITAISTGIATISGLPGVGFEELVSFSNGLLGIAFNVDKDEVGVILLGDYQGLHAGDEVTRTGRVMDAVVGAELLGRVISPLGMPLDGKACHAGSAPRPRYCSAPAIIDRSPVLVPLQTGWNVIDAMIPIGRGQR